jgi:hypothetical protein
MGMPFRMACMAPQQQAQQLQIAKKRFNIASLKNTW